MDMANATIPPAVGEYGFLTASVFGNHLSSEAVSGALPIGRNSPQRPPFGLYAEQFSATAFTAPRAENRRSWLYRIRPSADHPAFVEMDKRLLRSGPFDETPVSPNRLRWNPPALPLVPTDFVEGLVTYAGNGDPAHNEGCAIHYYLANRSMDRRAFVNSDGEMLIVPQQGRITLITEMGRLSVSPCEIAVVPRGLKFKVMLSGPVRGYVCENYGAMFRLPELGPIGSNSLANPRDFTPPTAWFEDQDESYEIVQKFMGRLWHTHIGYSPFDVVGWHGNLSPYKYDLRRFNTLGSISFDHPDPSIFTVLTSPTSVLGTANCDFVIFPERWLVAEDTFRPPWFHRNIMSEFMGLIHGVYDAKAEGFLPGGASLHNSMTSHGPDVTSHAKATGAELAPHKVEGTLAFMFETRAIIRPTAHAARSEGLQADYDHCWSGFPKAVLPDTGL